MDFFAVRSPLAYRHPMISPGQSHLLAFSNVPAQMTLATGDLDAFVLDPAPLTIKQLVALTMVEPDLVDVLAQQALFLPCTRTRTRNKAQ